MDPGLAHADLSPPRPSVFARGVVPALVAHVLLGVALGASLNWNRTPDPDRIVSVPGLDTPTETTASTAILGGSAASRTTATRAGQREPAEPVIQPGLASARNSSGTVREAGPAAATGSPSPAPEVARVTPAPARDAPSTRIAMGAPSAPADTAAVRPSFDCDKARSPAERAICADPELAQLDRDLGRLYARAKAAAPDAAAFRRENDAQWKLRETTCRGDGGCLRAWYTQRRDQLQAVVGNTAAGR